MRAQLLRILADAQNHPTQPPPVVRYNPTTEEATLISFANSPFQLVDIEHKKILQTKKLSADDKSYHYAVIFFIKHQSFTSESKKMPGQAYYAPFAFLHKPQDASVYTTRSSDARALSAITAHFRLYAISDGKRNRITYGKIDGSQLRSFSAVTTCDHLHAVRTPAEPLAIYRSSKQLLIVLKNLTLDEALKISKASLSRLNNLLTFSEINQRSKEVASVDFYSTWQALRVYDYYRNNKSPICRCYNHCIDVWHDCLSKETSNEGLLIKRAIKHFQAIYSQLTLHLREQKVLPDPGLKKLLDKKIEPSICDCSSLFWNRAKACSGLFAAVAGVAVTAALTFGGSSEQ